MSICFISLYCWRYIDCHVLLFGETEDCVYFGIQGDHPEKGLSYFRFISFCAMNENIVVGVNVITHAGQV